INRNNQLIETVQKYDYNHKNIKVGSVAPGPLILLKKLQSSKLADANLDLDHKLMDTKDVSVKLLNHDHSFILTNQELMTDEIESLYIGTERLSVNLNQFTLLANKKSVSFKDRKSTRLNSSHVSMSYAVYCLKKKITKNRVIMEIGFSPVDI